MNGMFGGGVVWYKDGDWGSLEIWRRGIDEDRRGGLWSLMGKRLEMEVGCFGEELELEVWRFERREK